MASFALEEFETALEAFRQGQQLSGPGTGENDPRKYRTWIRKCEAEMEEDEESPLPSDNTPVSKDASNAAESGASPGASQVAKPSASARVPASSAHAHLSIRFQYYQSYEKITVAVLEKGLRKDHVAVEVEARRLTVRRKDDDALLFNKVLYEEVLPEKSRTRFLPSKVRRANSGMRTRVLNLARRSRCFFSFFRPGERFGPLSLRRPKDLCIPTALILVRNFFLICTDLLKVRAAVVRLRSKANRFNPSIDMSSFAYGLT